MVITAPKACANSDCPNVDADEREFYSRACGRPHARCRQCHREASARRYHDNRDDAAEKSREYRKRNLAQIRAYDRARYEDRKEEHLTYMREWKKRNRPIVDAHEAVRRARMAIHAEPIDRFYIFDREGGRCHICEKLVPRDSFTLDHLVPLSRGGHHVATNVRVAHRVCNARMGVARFPAQLLLVA